ncbi:MAG: TetR/AcrR family transcriptional regulator [Acidimicrobiales bacterium]
MAPPPSTTRSSKRELLIDTALDLFRSGGYHATGVEQIVERAGTARMTLYAHFGSKDELLLAALARLDQRFQDELAERMAMVTEGRARLLTLFDVLEDLVASPTFSGCFFVNIANEFTDRQHPVHRAATAHKLAVATLVANAATEVGVADGAALAQQLLVLFDGAIVGARLNGSGDVSAGRRAAEQLVDAALAAPVA